MASIFEVGHRPKRQSDRRTAVVAFLLSPKPSTLLMIMVAMCGLWTILVGWGALTLLQLITS